MKSNPEFDNLKQFKREKIVDLREIIESNIAHTKYRRNANNSSSSIDYYDGMKSAYELCVSIINLILGGF